MLAELKNEGFAIIAADADGTDQLRIPEGKFVLALGNEGNGLSSRCLKMADDIVKIPINVNRAESLNVASAGAICMYMLSR